MVYNYTSKANTKMGPQSLHVQIEVLPFRNFQEHDSLQDLMANQKPEIEVMPLATAFYKVNQLFVTGKGWSSLIDYRKLT